MAFNLDLEKKRYCDTVNVDSTTYSSEFSIEKRSRRIFGTFARTLPLQGEADLEKQRAKVKREEEKENLFSVCV